MVGDLLMTCTGGVPTPAGQSIPQINITVLFNTNVTSKLVALGTQFSEALLIVDEPASQANPAAPVLIAEMLVLPIAAEPGPEYVSR
jgi:hypothetical protein